MKESEEDVSKADEYLDKKKEKKVVRGSNSDLRNGNSYIIQHGSFKTLYIKAKVLEHCMRTSPWMLKQLCLRPM